jgi:hypothetical protein
VAVLTALAFAVTIWSAIAGRESVGVYLLAGYALAMLLNVLLPNLISSFRGTGTDYQFAMYIASMFMFNSRMNSRNTGRESDFSSPFLGGGIREG